MECSKHVAKKNSSVPCHDNIFQVSKPKVEVDFCQRGLMTDRHGLFEQAWALQVLAMLHFMLRVVRVVL